MNVQDMCSLDILKGLPEVKAQAARARAENERYGDEEKVDSKKKSTGVVETAAPGFFGGFAGW